MALFYFNMACMVIIGNVKFNVVNSISVTESIKQFSNTATIVLPREFSDVKIGSKTESISRKNILDFICEDDIVEIKLGYDENLQTYFKGYLKEIGADIPLVLECEDEMYWLKRTEKFNKTFPSVKLSELLKFIAPGYSTEIIDDIPLGKFIIENSTAYEVLEALKRDYLMHSYFVGKTLHVGFPSSIKPIKIHKVNINRNVKNSSNLVFVRKANQKLQIDAISTNSNGTKIKKTVGESGGSTRTLNFANKTEKELESLAKSQLATLSFDGYSGDISMFGFEKITAGESVEITDTNYMNSDRQGQYLIEAVTTDFNENSGLEQKVTLSLKL